MHLALCSILHDSARKTVPKSFADAIGELAQFGRLGIGFTGFAECECIFRTAFLLSGVERWRVLGPGADCRCAMGDC